MVAMNEGAEVRHGGYPQSWAVYVMENPIQMEDGIVEFPVGSGDIP